MNLFRHITGYTLTAVLLMSIWLAEQQLAGTTKIGDIEIFRIPENCSNGYYLKKHSSTGDILALVDKVNASIQNSHLSRMTIGCPNEMTCFTYNVTSDQDFGYYYLFKYNSDTPCHISFYIKEPNDDDLEESTTMTTNHPTPENTTSSRWTPTFLSTNVLTTISTYEDLEKSTTMTTNTPTTENTTSSRWTPTFLSTNALATISTSGATVVQTSISVDILQKLKSGNTTALEALKELAKWTKTSALVKNELHQIESVLEEIINNLTLDVSDLQTVTTYFMEVASNLINTTKAHLWREKLKMNNSGAESIINLVDKMVSRLLNVASNESIKLNFTSPELYVEVVTAVECQENITFPYRKEVDIGSNFAQTMCPEGVNTTSYSGVIYYDIGEFIKLPTDRGNMSKPVDVSNRTKVQPTIISFTNPGFDGRVLINIKVDNQKHKDSVCVFLDIRENMWLDEGCKLVSHDINAVRCECNHLTNFAVLMSVMDVVVCTAVAVILHFSLLTVFSLMLAIGIDYMLIVVKPLYTNNLGNPMILASFDRCWLSMENSAKLTFIIPVCLVVCVNIGIVIVMFKAMFNQSSMKKKTGEEKIRTSIRNIFILSPVFGFTWIIGIFAVNKETIAFQYIFVILNGLQGVLIMVCHCILNQKVRGIVRSRTYRRKLILESSNQATNPTVSTQKLELQSITAV